MELVKKGFVPQEPAVNIPSWIEEMMVRNGIRGLPEFPAALTRDPLMTGMSMERLEELADILESGKVDGYSRVHEVIKRYYDPSAHFVPRISEEAKAGLVRLGIDEKKLSKHSVNEVFPHTFFFGVRGMEVLPFQWAAAMLPGRFSTENKDNLFKYVEGDIRNLKDILPTMRIDEQTVIQGFNKNGEFRMDMFHLKLAIGRGREACLRAFDNAIISLLHPVRKKIFRDGSAH